MKAFADQIAVITGASGGIGGALAMGFAAEGAVLCLVGRNLEMLEAVASRARTTNQRVLCHYADLSLDEDIQKLATRLKRDFGRVDVLIHGAGVISLGKLEQAAVEHFDWQYRTNVRGPYVLTQALLPLLRARQGQIVFINSSAGLDAKAGMGQYAATKHGLKAIADTVREELNPQGIRILSVFVGRTATPMQAHVHEVERREYRPELLLQPQDVVAVVINALGLPRTAEVTDISIRPLSNLLRGGV